MHKMSELVSELVPLGTSVQRQKPITPTLCRKMNTQNLNQNQNPTRKRGRGQGLGALNMIDS
jgi:hypothetical protein